MHGNHSFRRKSDAAKRVEGASRSGNRQRGGMPEVRSSAIDRIDYAPTAGTLDVLYKGGGRYRYFEVPAEVYRALLAAPSIGAFVNGRVKERYRFEQEPGRRRFRPE